MVAGERCKIGYEEQIEEKLDGVGFMSLVKYKFCLVGTDAWILYPRDNVVFSLSLTLQIPVTVSVGG